MAGLSDGDQVPDHISGGVGAPRVHDSAVLHVSGQARFIDDLPEPAGTLQVYIAWAQRAHARLVALDLSAVRAARGVAAVIAAADVPGVNEISSAHVGDEPLFAVDRVMYWGQPLFAVAADDLPTARRAAGEARIVYEDLPLVLDAATAHRTHDHVLPAMRIVRGNAVAALASAPRRLAGTLTIGGQDHFYLEGQIAMARPGEAGEMTVLSSTQHPSEVQHMVARVLGIDDAAVTCEVRRMGGGFGGKESQANLPACVAAIVAAKTGRPAKCRMDRDDDMIVTGKRHDFRTDYEVGFDEEGRIAAVAMTMLSRCGWSADLSGPVNARALCHADNAYYYPAAALEAFACRTNTVSNTAFRGFGGPQGVVAAERLVEAIAFELGRDPLDIRKINLYGGEGRTTTPYGQTVEHNRLLPIIERLEQQCDYRARRAAGRAFNAGSPWLKRGIALTPVKFGISFNMTAYNQAGALVHIYKDGSVHLNHGGTEMGQGLFVKVAQVVAEELALAPERIRITATTTAKVPNTSATAASTGSDLNGMAALAAARTLKERLIAFVAERHQAPPAAVRWLPGRVEVAGNVIAYEELVQAAYLARVQLSATGFYKTPEIHWDRTRMHGQPFFYFAYGAACSDVLVDTLTGEHKVERVDIIHDVGNSLNPAIDRGQIEGAFIQGMGWLTMEELWWDERGRLRTHAPSTYKIPCCSDRPGHFMVQLWDEPNAAPTIFRSKAVGEPPLMLAISVLHAISDAVAAVADHRIDPSLDPPATPECVLRAVSRLRGPSILS